MMGAGAAGVKIILRSPLGDLPTLRRRGPRPQPPPAAAGPGGRPPPSRAVAAAAGANCFDIPAPGCCAQRITPLS